MEYTEYVVPNVMRIYAAEVNALLNIGRDYAMILIEGIKKFWNSGIMDEYDFIKEEFFGPYAFRVFLDSARIFCKTGEKEKAVKILKFLTDYLFLEGFHIDYWHHLGTLPAFIKITILLEYLGEGDIRITDKIYDEIKDKEADMRAAILSEILITIQK
ncbi:MAG: hypothetical protein GW779_02385 [Candidatus Altiarchaeum hamiconexum]|uniref:Uncharacterized protein n=1 Tax=Candidatus Altarchaeum hamiconexum TaxID=1803513 RepID=A0A8J7Z1F8_9ARCH|nr:hypothetical protein [Candidatus Altarchaeum hamiconexum]NCN68584.1 hypothetical protein [Candidatus Altarchaeum hamiconexum]NCS91258.1 hypothetical protein [Candidatus Altarchaeum hamiconexum]NCT00381.1 hypothetical protein [Candidatus Altarchaeum hamiconexum]